MATVDKAFRIKNGLVVEGSSATVNGSNVLTEASTEFLQDTTAAMFDGAQSGISFSYNDTSGKITATVSTTPTFADRIIFEGNTPDDFELTLLAPEPTQDVTVTLPNATDTLVGKATTDTFTNKTFDTGDTGNTFQIQNNTINSYSGSGSTVILNNTPTISSLFVNSGLNLNGSTTGHTQLLAQSTASGTITFPAVTGTVVTTGDTGSVTNTMLAGSIANDKLSNSSITVNGASISLGGSQTITAVNPNALTIGTGLSGTSYDGSSAVTVAIDSTVATTSGTQTLTNKTLTSPVVSGLALSDSSIVFEGSSADANETTLTVTNPTADRTITLPDVTGTVITTGDSGTVTNAMLQNSSITINGTATALGGSINITAGVSSVSGTSSQIAVSSTTGDITLSLPSAVVFPGTVTLNADPQSALEAATKQYVDAVAEGLHVHASVVAATTANVDLSTGLEAGDVIDGVTLVAGDRVLVKNQSTTSENGIYIASTSGVAVRASDYNTASEIDPGDFFFVTGGTNYDNTGWVQTAVVTTLGTDPITFEQFSGAGTYLAGNGLTLTGNTFSINTGVTVDLNTAQTLTNKTLTSPSITTPTVTGLKLNDSSIVFEGSSADDFETTLSVVNPTADRTITLQDGTGTLAFTSDIETAVDNFGNAVTGGTGITASYATTNNVLTITNAGVTSITGTADQISATASTGAVTLSLPQSIATTSSPAFASIGVGYVTLTDALMGTATTSVTTTSATVVDSWAAATFKSAKYVVQMRNGNDIEVLEALVTVDGNNNVYITEYADVQSNAQIGTIDADYSGSDVRLLVTSTNGTTVKVHRTLIEA
jgi:hypothetical protein